MMRPGLLLISLLAALVSSPTRAQEPLSPQLVGQGSELGSPALASDSERLDTLLLQLADLQRSGPRAVTLDALKVRLIEDGEFRSAFEAASARAGTAETLAAAKRLLAETDAPARLQQLLFTGRPPATVIHEVLRSGDPELIDQAFAFIRFAAGKNDLLASEPALADSIRSWLSRGDLKRRTTAADAFLRVVRPPLLTKDADALEAILLENFRAGLRGVPGAQPRVAEMILWTLPDERFSPKLLEELASAPHGGEFGRIAEGRVRSLTSAQRQSIPREELALHAKEAPRAALRLRGERTARNEASLPFLTSGTDAEKRYVLALLDSDAGNFGEKFLDSGIRPLLRDPDLDTRIMAATLLLKQREPLSVGDRRAIEQILNSALRGGNALIASMRRFLRLLPAEHFRGELTQTSFARALRSQFGEEEARILLSKLAEGGIVPKGALRMALIELLGAAQLLVLERPIQACSLRFREIAGNSETP